MRRRTPTSILRGGWALAALALVLAACGSSPSSNGGAASSADSTLGKATSTLLANLDKYEAQATKCKTESNPVVCLESADHTLGGQIHDYANLLVSGHGFSAPEADVLNARNAAQTLANSMEILGDAQPTQSNYDQVLNTFNVNNAIEQLRSAATTLKHASGG